MLKSRANPSRIATEELHPSYGWEMTSTVHEQ